MQGKVTFFDWERNPGMVLTPISSNTIENREWRIEKYPADGAQRVDSKGLTNAKHLATISFVNGRIDGTPGCGGWVGDYNLSHGHLLIHTSVALAGMCYPT